MLYQKKERDEMIAENDEKFKQLLRKEYPFAIVDDDFNLIFTAGIIDDIQ